MRLPTVTAAICLLAAAPAAAEWIVPVAGEAIETAGPWELRGSSVVFTRTDGGLFLLPASQVDWPRTRWRNLHPARRAVGRFVHTHGLEIPDATTMRWVVGALIGRDGAPVAGTATAARRRPLLVLTDADVAHVTPRRPLPADEFPIRWRRSFDGTRPDELLIVGTVENRSQTTVRAVAVELRFVDADGEPIQVLEVEVGPAVLPPGASGEFRCLPRLAGFDKIDSSARGRIGKPD